MGCAICRWSAHSFSTRVYEMTRLLHLSRDYRDQTPGRTGITGLEHAFRTAGMMKRYDHPDAALVGLVHDLARPLNDVHHGEIMAEMVRDRVSEDAYNVLRTHGAFQSAIVHSHPWPEIGGEAQLLARALTRAEVASFGEHYSGPVLTWGEASCMIRERLG